MTAMSAMTRDVGDLIDKPVSWLARLGFRHLSSRVRRVHPVKE